MLAVPQIQGPGEDTRKVQDDLQLRIYPAALLFLGSFQNCTKLELHPYSGVSLEIYVPA